MNFPYMQHRNIPSLQLHLPFLACVIVGSHSEEKKEMDTGRYSKIRILVCKCTEREKKKQ